MASGNKNDALRVSGSRVSDDDAARQLLATCLSKSWSNQRKRPSVFNALDDVDIAQHDLSLSEVGNTTDQPHKRSRAADWPLRTTTASNARPVTPRRARKAPLSPGQRHNLIIRPRPSKFLEGSMNDRVSARPPSIYTRDEAAMEQYHDHKFARGLGSNDSSNAEDKKYFDAGIETSKPSGMYRFGRALVSAFNPVSVWQGINGIWKEKEQQSHPDTKLLQEHKLKAEKTYAEMKQYGFKGIRPSLTQTASEGQSILTSRNSQSDALDSSLRSSDAGLDRPCPSTTFKHGRPTPTGSEDLLIPPTLMEAPRVTTPATYGKDGHRASLNIRRPSVQSLKKVKSHIQLPSTKRKAADAALLSPSLDAISKEKHIQALRRQPSKKDVAKRQKLSKQVSNLEGKLKAARRELELCNAETSDVPEISKSARKAFVPGTLSSLPSESNINPKNTNVIAQDSGPDRQPPSSRRISNQNSIPKKQAVKGPKLATKPRLNKLESSGRKRKSSNDRGPDSSYKPKGNMDHGSDSDLSVSAKKTPCARKSQKLDESSAKPGIEATTKQSPAGASRSPRGSISKYQTSVPPVPPLVVPFDPAEIDRSKLLAMRSIPKDDLPFGSHLDDIVNLQKEFPHWSQKQLDEYLWSLSKGQEADGKIQNLENQQPNAPSHTCSTSGSPTRPSAFQDAPVRSRPACKNSSPNKKMGRELSTINEAITVDPSKDKSVPPMPNSFKLKTRSAETDGIPKGEFTDKPLPKIQKEDYTWPEDVF
ncbi:MAG: hypothetical protein Q9188_000353 [Gyalolechia gomerana]